MRIRHVRKNHNFFDVPVLSQYYQHPLDQDLFFAESLVSFVDKSGEKSSFYGASSNKDYLSAIRVSCYEIFERMLASRAFYSDDEIAQGFSSYYLFSNQPTSKIIPAENVLIRGQSDKLNKIISASGLGFNSSITHAISHATLELLERHILCKIWYDNWHVHEIDSPEQLPEQYKISFFTVDLGIPFVMALITCENNPIFFTGSSLSNNFYLAKLKARSEALHLLTNLLFGKLESQFGNPTESINIIKTLVGEDAVKRLNFFNNKINKKLLSLDSSNISLLQICKNILLDPEKIEVIELKRWKDFRLVRVYTDEAWTKNKLRYTFMKSNHVPDPFC